MIPSPLPNSIFSYSNPEINQPSEDLSDRIESNPLMSRGSPLFRKTIPNSYESLSQDFDQTIQWNNSIVDLNDSISFPSSTHLIIASCNVSLLATNNTALIWEISSGSRLEIYNSNIFMNNTSTASCHIRFLGGMVIVSNSTISDLGSRGTSGFSIRNSVALIENSSFIRGYSGIKFVDNQWLNISNCYFTENNAYAINGESSDNIHLINNSFYSHPDSGIILTSCNNINVKFSNFLNQNDFAIEIRSCDHTNIINNSFTHFGTGIKVDTIPGDVVFHENVLISNNSLFNGTADGIYIDGVGVDVIETEFGNFPQNIITFLFGVVTDCNITKVGRYGIYFSGYNFYAARNTIKKAVGGVRCGGIFMGNYYPAMDIYLKNNTISDIDEFGIKYDDYTNSYFEIINNNISRSNGIGIAFYGTVGGNSNYSSLIVGNIINGTQLAAIDGKAFRSTFDNYNGDFVYVSIYKNAFLNCAGGFTRFDVVGYSVLQVSIDNGKWGNYWDGKQFSDQDHNMIGDSYYYVSGEWGLIDRAPLLSLDLLKEGTIGSTHPRDLTAVQNQKQTIEWLISLGAEVEVFIDGQSVDSSINSTMVTVELSDFRLSVGTHNVTLQLNSTVENTSLLYQDLVWLEIQRDDSWIADLVTLIQIFIAVFIAVAVGSAIYVRQVIKRRFFRKQFAVEFRGIIDISETESNLREARKLEEK